MAVDQKVQWLVDLLLTHGQCLDLPACFKVKLPLCVHQSASVSFLDEVLIRHRMKALYECGWQEDCSRKLFKRSDCMDQST